jgi:hypothetical protein
MPPATNSPTCWTDTREHPGSGKRGWRWTRRVSAQTLRPKHDSGLRWPAEVFPIPTSTCRCRWAASSCASPTCVAVEYDGEGHSDPTQVLKDISRDEDFAAADWILVRIGKTHMENDARAAVRKVRLALLARGWSPSG